MQEDSMFAHIVGYDSTRKITKPETWVQDRSAIQIMGKTPGVIVEKDHIQYRHSEDGRLWRRVR